MSSDPSMAVTDLCSAGWRFDLRFLELIVGLHRTEISLPQDALVHAAHPAILDFARAVVQARTDEINMIDRWIAETMAAPVID